jgi:23S rRNA (uridine2552-2'-O)-methyltransferase
MDRGGADVNPAWRKEQARDRFFRRAKVDGYRARSAYKLLEIASKHSLLRPGEAVVDLGAAPGSWTQVALDRVGPTGRVVAVDITVIAPLGSALVLQMDITASDCPARIAEALARPADAVLSDAAPSTTGVALVDHVRSMELCDASLAVAVALLRPGGAYVAKAFRGEDFDGFVREVRRHFARTEVTVPEATRSESKEAFVIGLGLRSG